MTYWGNDSYWRSLPSTQRAAAMALLEADKRDPTSAKNALGAMINRSNREKVDLGDHVSGRIYQPTIEPTQYQRLKTVVGTPQHKELTDLAEKRLRGEVPDWVEGNTHFLAHEPTMEQLRAREPGKYRSWVNWTGYNKGGGQYSNPDGQPVFRDKSHAFLAPDGRHSAVFSPQPPDGMDAATHAPASRSPKMEEEGFFSKIGGWLNTPIGEARRKTQAIRDRYADPNASLDPTKATAEEFLNRYPALNKPGIREQIPAMLDVYRMGNDLNSQAINARSERRAATPLEAFAEALKVAGGAVSASRGHNQIGMQMVGNVGADWRSQNDMRDKMMLQSKLQQAQALTAGSDAAIKDAMARMEKKRHMNTLAKMAGEPEPFPEASEGAIALPSGTKGVGGVSAAPAPVERGALPDVGAQPQVQTGAQPQPQARVPIQSNAASAQAGDDLLRKAKVFSMDPSTKALGEHYMEQYKLQQGSPTGLAAQRAEVAKSLGMTPDHPAYQSFVATGKMPREDQAMLTATDKKAIMEAEEMALTSSEAIKSLDHALNIGTPQVDPKTGKTVQPNMNMGYTAKLRANLADKMPDLLVPDFISSKESAKNTLDFDNAVMGQALASMKAIFGGNPTEGERAVLLDLQGSADKSPEVRKAILDRARSLAQRRLELYQERAKELRGGDYYKPKDGSKSDYKNVPRTSTGQQQPSQTSVDYSTMSDDEIKKQLGLQ